jgi:putative endonuclease
MFTVYILHSNTLDRYYVGFTNDFERRLTEHNRKKGKYTDSGLPWKLVYQETYSTKTEAMNREKFIKQKKSRIFIESLISSSAG